MSACPTPSSRRRTLGRLEDLETLLVGEQVDEVHVGLPVKSHYRQIQDTIQTCEHLGVKVLYPADIVDTTLAKPRMLSADSGPHVQLQMAPEGMLVRVKRCIDVIGAVVALVPLAPIMLAAAVAIRLTSDGPVIYAQERYGLNRRRFRMFKFRTMVQDAERLQASLESRNEASGPVFKIADDPRITPLGRFLRRTLDRRAAAALQRAAWRHVAGRATSPAVARRRPLHPHGRLATVQHAARRDLPVADQRTQRHRLR